MGTEQRRNRRIVAYAKAVHSPTGTPGYIRDLSSTGCQVSFVQPLAVGPGDGLALRVIAEHDPAIAPFPVRLTARWSRSDGIWFCVGGELAAPPGDRERESFAALVAYYEQASRQATSGPGPTPDAASCGRKARASRPRSRRG